MNTIVTRRRFAGLAGLALTAAGMAATRAWAATLAKPQGKVVLTISGLIGNTNNGDKADFDMPMLEALGTTSFTTKTPWYKDPVSFTGVLHDMPASDDDVLNTSSDGTVLRSAQLPTGRAAL